LNYIHVIFQLILNMLIVFDLLLLFGLCGFHSRACTPCWWLVLPAIQINLFVPCWLASFPVD
jgi:hypothetical protein